MNKKDAEGLLTIGKLITIIGVLMALLLSSATSLNVPLTLSYITIGLIVIGFVLFIVGMYYIDSHWD